MWKIRFVAVEKLSGQASKRNEALRINEEGALEAE